MANQKRLLLLTVGAALAISERERAAMKSLSEGMYVKPEEPRIDTPYGPNKGKGKNKGKRRQFRY